MSTNTERRELLRIGVGALIVCGDSHGPVLSEPAGEWALDLPQEGDEVVPLPCFRFSGVGQLPQPGFEESLERLRTAIEAAGPLDAVLLALSGRTAVEGLEDADGSILAEVRAAFSPGMRLAACFGTDADLSPFMVRSCDLLAGSPGEALRLLCAELQPVMALAKPPLWIDPQAPALSEVLEWIREVEQEPGVLHVAIATGSGMLDEPRMGAGVLVVTDGDPDLAAEVAEAVAAELWSRRRQLAPGTPGRVLTQVRTPLYPFDRELFDR